ncbi:MAG: hypothetical protein EPN41_05505 [Candidimonas sp.]|nr:MAG: hypothetical protein EPN41_05505 [Candidimonas sp.]
MSSPADHYKGFTDLASAQVEGTDYRVHVRANAGSAVAVIAPHGGSIQQYTSDVARDIAGADSFAQQPSFTDALTKRRG